MKVGYAKIVWMTLFLLGISGCGTLFAEQLIPEGENAGIIKGKIALSDGTPFSTGFVAFFDSDNLSPMDYGSTRRSPKMIAFLDDNGTFSTHVMAAGTYYVGAMMRQRWRGGPPQRGEKRYSAFDENDEYLLVTLGKGQTLDIGTVKMKEPKAAPELKEYFTIKGRLLDDKGAGIFDSVVVVKKDYDDPKALFISDKSAIDGSYEMKLPPGKYFLLARETVAGSTRPKPGSIYGELGQNDPVGIGGKTTNSPTYILGKDKQLYYNVNITMFEVPIPDVKRKETEEMVRTNKMSKESLPDNLPLKKRKAENAVQSPLKAETEGALSKEK